MLGVSIFLRPINYGELDDCVLRSISIMNRFSLEIIESDVEQAGKDFSEFYEAIRSIFRTY